MFELRAKSEKETDILLYGSISEWGRVRAEDLFNKIGDAKAKGYESVNLKINSPGGSIFEGIACMSQMSQQDIIIVGTVEGIAASMASAMLQGCHKRRMVKGSRLMVHQGTGGVFGSANYIRDYADLLTSLNKTLADIYAKKTKRDSKWILDNWMAEGKDTWFTAEQALKEGLIDEIVEGKLKPLEKEEATLLEMAAHYQSQLDTTDNAMNKETRDALIKLYSLKAEATDAEILAAATAAKAPASTPAPVATATSAPAAPTTAPVNDVIVNSVVALAKARGVTDETKIASIKKLAAIDAQLAIEMLPPDPNAKVEATAAAEVPKPLSITELVAALKGGEGTTDRKDWTLANWQEKDSAGLLAMAQAKPEQYATLFEKAHGYKPTTDEIQKLAGA